RYFSPYFEGASERAQQLGYRLEEIWLRQPGMTMRRIAQILDQRGIEGVIVTMYMHHFRFNWDHLAGVSLEHVTLAPRLHRVTTDFFSNFLLAVRMLQRFGYRRIGVCLDAAIALRTRHTIRATIHYHEAMLPRAKRIPPMFYPGAWQKSWREVSRQIVAW